MQLIEENPGVDMDEIKFGYQDFQGDDIVLYIFSNLKDIGMYKK